MLVAPLVFRAPSGPAVGPGCLVCPWAAARPRAVRAASLRLGASTRCPARPRRRPRAPQPGPPALRRLHTSDAWCATCCLARWCDSRPGPAAAHGHRSPALRPSCASTPAVRLVLLCVAPSCLLLSNFARNSPVTISVFELASLELERFWAVFKSDRGKLRADLVLPRLCRRPRVPQPGLRILRPPPHRRCGLFCCVLHRLACCSVISHVIPR